MIINTICILNISSSSLFTIFFYSQYKNCKVCGFVYIHDEKSKTDKHETSTGENTRNENSILENATNENTIQRNTTSEEQKQTLRKMFRLKPEDKNVFVMLKLG